jgi:hypothetical protein
VATRQHAELDTARRAVLPGADRRLGPSRGQLLEWRLRIPRVDSFARRNAVRVVVTNKAPLQLMCLRWAPVPDPRVRLHSTRRAVGVGLPARREVGRSEPPEGGPRCLHRGLFFGSTPHPRGDAGATRHGFHPRYALPPVSVSIALVHGLPTGQPSGRPLGRPPVRLASRRDGPETTAPAGLGCLDSSFPASRRFDVRTFRPAPRCGRRGGFGHSVAALGLDR